mmetsp:Transcript_20721/g.57585  ORF Transcript_20721/g.57585 Transcript_20721/m.57585 type:complete len:126 (-) Transcript_20721:1018-1395(-)
MTVNEVSKCIHDDESALDKDAAMTIDSSIGDDLDLGVMLSTPEEVAGAEAITKALTQDEITQLSDDNMPMRYYRAHEVRSVCAPQPDDGYVRVPVTKTGWILLCLFLAIRLFSCPSSCCSCLLAC